jgi:hypothetical protein
LLSFSFLCSFLVVSLFPAWYVFYHFV